MSDDRGAVGQIPGEHNVQVANILVALGTSDDLVLMTNRLGAKIRVEEVTFTPETAVTGNDTNNMLLAVHNKGVGGGGAVVVAPAKEYDSGTDLTAFVGDDIPVSATEADRELDIDETLALIKTETNSGLVLPAGVVTVRFIYL